MPRYLKVRGKPGILASNPHADPSARRYAGMTRKADPPQGPPRSLGLADHYEPVEEVLEDHRDLRRASRNDIELLAIGVGPSPDKVTWTPCSKAGDSPAPAPIIPNRTAKKGGE